MKQALDHLYSILCQERSLCQEFLAISQQKTDVILSGDTAGLESVTQFEQGLIKKAGALERARAQAMDALNQGADLPMPATLADIIARVPEEARETLEAMRQDLQTLLMEQQQINALNGRLLKNNLEYIQNILGKARGSSDGIHLMDRTV